MRVFKAALAAADMALCSECLNLILDEMPVVEDDHELGKPRASVGKVVDTAATASGSKKTRESSGKPASGSATVSPPARGKAASSATTGSGKHPGRINSASGSSDGPQAATSVSPLVRDVKEIAELLRVFLTRVMSTSAASSTAGAGR